MEVNWDVVAVLGGFLVGQLAGMAWLWWKNR